MRLLTKSLITVAILLAILAYLIIFTTPNYQANSIKARPKKIRPPAVSGSFYPSNQTDLENMLKTFLNKTKEVDNVKALVVPHAGYIYSGGVAGTGFKQLEKEHIKRVIILAPSHHARFSGASIPNTTHYQTPLGLVKISNDVEKLRKENSIVSLPKAHTKEHALEIELPFLQYLLKDVKIIPIITSNINPETLADTLLSYIDDSTLVIASSDLSHYYAYHAAVAKDKSCIQAIPALNFTLIQKCEACGKTPILTVMHLAKKRGWKGKLLEYKNSGDTAGTKQRVVGYASIAFHTGPSEKEKRTLLNIARKTLEGYYNNKASSFNITSTALKKIQGCFVTLKKQGQLRGCIGHILPQEKLYKCVEDNTLNAALNDRRFPPLQKQELGDINIEISILTTPKKLEYKNSSHLLNKIDKDMGIILKQGFKQSTYLPQVWEQITNKTTFLQRLCRKAAMTSNCWKTAEVHYYRAIHFSEKD